MNILLITSTLKPESGWGTYSLNTLRGLRTDGHQVSVLTAEHSSQDESENVTLPGPLSMLGSPVAWMQFASALRGAVKKHHPDVIHILVEPYAIAMPLASAMTQLPPWVMNLHGTYSVLPFVRPLSRALFSRAFNQCSGFLACSDFTYNRVANAVRKYGSKSLLVRLQEKVRMFRFGILPSVITKQRSVSSEYKTILYVGGIKERKGIKELIEGCAEYVRSAPAPVRIVLVGHCDPQNSYVLEVRELIRRHGLENMVTFEGLVSEERREELYAAADVYVMLSKSDDVYFEGFGLVFLEANQRGIPVIGSRDSGCREAIHEGVSGYAVDAHNSAEVAERLKFILEEGRIDPAACKAWAAEHSMERQTRSCEELYLAVIGARPLAIQP